MKLNIECTDFYNSPECLGPYETSSTSLIHRANGLRMITTKFEKGYKKNLESLKTVKDRERQNKCHLFIILFKVTKVGCSCG